MISKTELRKILLKKRKAISSARREQAAKLLVENLHTKGGVLSFSTMGSEINMTPLNEHLARENRLFLVPYKLEDLTHVPLSKIECILVPALGFDKEMTRLGYGKGCYDRFLAQVGNIRTIGIGFKEQLYESTLPKDPWDIAVKELLLV